MKLFREEKKKPGDPTICKAKITQNKMAGRLEGKKVSKKMIHE
jgi:hypothetical protein